MMSMIAAVVVSLALALAPAELLGDPEAKRLFDEAQAAFETGDYATASERLESAYLIEPEPALLYPWAQAERQLERCASAIGLYEKFLDSKPSERMASAAQGNIERCRAKIAEANRVEPTPTEPGAHEDAAPAGSDDGTTVDELEPDPGARARSDKVGVTVGATLLGVGVVGLVVGGTLLGLAAGRAKASGEAAIESRYLELRKQATTFRSAGIAVVAIGGAFVVGGVVQLAIVGAKRRKQKKSRVAMFFDGTGGGVVWAGKF